jgi:hypothetical protein
MRASARTLANRRNARRSTGPRTSEGKSRVAKNALRHGLAMPVGLDPQLGGEVENLAQIIAGQGANAVRFEAARRIAEAEIDLLRVRRARRALLVDPTARVKLSIRQLRRMIKVPMRRADAIIAEKGGDYARIFDEDLEVLMDEIQSLADGEILDSMIPTFEEGFGVLAVKLMRLDRYERRALSRRKTAIREFDGLD